MWTKATQFLLYPVLRESREQVSLFQLTESENILKSQSDAHPETPQEAKTEKPSPQRKNQKRGGTDKKSDAPVSKKSGRNKKSTDSGEN